MNNSSIDKYAKFQDPSHPKLTSGLILPDKTSVLQNNEIQLGAGLFQRLYFNDIIEIYNDRQLAPGAIVHAVLCVRPMKFVQVARDAINTLFTDPKYKDRLDVIISKDGDHAVPDTECHITGIITMHDTELPYIDHLWRIVGNRHFLSKLNFGLNGVYSYIKRIE